MNLKQRKVIKQSAQESMEAVIDLVRNFETKLRPPSGVKNTDKLSVYQDLVVDLIDLIYEATEEIE